MKVHKLTKKDLRIFAECRIPILRPGGEYAYQWGDVTCKRYLKLKKKRGSK